MRALRVLWGASFQALSDVSICASLKVGDIVVLRDAVETGRVGLRYRVNGYNAESDWISLHRVRKDGQPDRRERGFSGRGNDEYVAEGV